MKELNFSIEGMHCKSCAKIIEGTFEEEGINADVDFGKCQADVTYNNEEERLKILKILSLLRKRGYKISNA
jgi:copper chaperone CopZ